MNCQEMEQLFDAYLDQQMSSSLRLEFDAHRLRCPVCQQKLAMLEACEQAIISDRRSPDLSSDFTDRLMGQIGSRRPAPKPRSRTLWVAAGVLQVAAAILFALLWLRPAPEPAPRQLVASDPERLEDILRNDDADELYRYINERVETLRAARANLSDDVGGLTRMALSIGVPEELLNFDHVSPLERIFQTLVPSPPTEERDDPTASDVYSL